MARLTPFCRFPDPHPRRGPPTGSGRAPGLRPGLPGGERRDGHAVDRTGPRTVEDLPYELVERKGVGHPDTMCDAMAERMSRYYSQYCLKEFGGVAHHWFDKVTLYGGGADTDYGRGRSPRRTA
ncbi:methionine adenosyltransferase [Streptomyces sp. M19]